LLTHVCIALSLLKVLHFSLEPAMLAFSGEQRTLSIRAQRMASDGPEIILNSPETVALVFEPSYLLNSNF
jgi:hypothetical protein